MFIITTSHRKTILSYGVIHIVRTHQGGGGGGVSPKRTLFIKSTIFPIQNAYWGGGGGVGGGNKIFDFVRTYYVNDPYI